jgi:hypothetical protein
MNDDSSVSSVVCSKNSGDKKDPTIQTEGCWSYYTFMACFGNDLEDQLAEAMISSFEENTGVELNEQDCLLTPYVLNRN